MKIKSFEDFLYDLSSRMSNDDKIDLINEYSSCTTENIYTNDKWGMEEAFGRDALAKLIDAIKEDQYDYRDPYFTIDIYGDMETFDNIDDHYDIVEFMLYNDVYIEDYKNYLSDILDKIDNKEDLVKLRKIIEMDDMEDALDDFIEDIDKKSLALGGSRVE